MLTREQKLAAARLGEQDLFLLRRIDDHARSPHRGVINLNEIDSLYDMSSLIIMVHDGFIRTLGFQRYGNKQGFYLEITPAGQELVK